MLDVPLRQGAEASGVFCAEHVGGPRTWTVDEQNFAVSTANLIAVAVADEHRREALARVAESDARAHLILDTAHDAFVGMDTAGVIVAWNAQAAAHVRLDPAGSPGPQPRRDDHPARVSRGAQQRHAALPRHRRGPRRQQAARAARPASQRPRIPDRDHHHVADDARQRVLLRRLPARHLGSARPRRPVAPGEGCGRGRDAREERVPRQHEPRAAHAAQRRDRLFTAAAARSHAERDAARSARRDFQMRRPPARPDQRRARPVEDRGRLRRHRSRGDRPRAAHDRLAARRRRLGAAQGRPAQHGGGVRCAAAGRARRAASSADPVEPPRQRHQVHRRR